MMGRPFTIEPHDHADKKFAINGPDITLLVDYDVNHDQVDDLARKVANILNDNWK